MITLAIIIAAVGIALTVWGHNAERATPLALGGGLMLLALVATFLSMTVSLDYNIPEGFERVEYYSYVTEAGTVETLDGPYFKKDDAYYTQEMGSAYWIPFGQCEYVEANLPESATNYNG